MMDSVVLFKRSITTCPAYQAARVGAGDARA